MTATSEVQLVHSAALDQGGYPDNCPFNTGRPGQLVTLAESMGLLDEARRYSGVTAPASREYLEMFHKPSYLDLLHQAGTGSFTTAMLARGIGTEECPLFKDMLDYCLLLAGTAATAAGLLARGDARVVFNPSGGFHHAGPDYASGFCFINDVVLAILELRAAGLRVACVDVDAHHGDGVQNAFWEEEQVLVASLHESGKTLFPGTGFLNERGEGRGEGFTLNVPLPEGTYNEPYLRAFREVVLPTVQRFAPDVVVLELGMDALAGDPFTHLNLTNSAYVDIIHRLLELQVPLLATGGGGYNVHDTIRGWCLCWAVLSGQYEPDIAVGMGGVMLENTNWLGGLEDHQRVPTAAVKHNVDAEIDEIIRAARAAFP
jgi:acetoin utilization protein AcuC